MKRFYLFKFACLLIILSGLTINAHAQATTTTFLYTGSVQTFLIPYGVTSISVDMVGASGGNNSGSSWPSNGGLGGRVQGLVTVTPNTVIQVMVGGMGAVGVPGTGGAGGYNGGAVGGSTGSYGAGGGGGGCDIRVAPYAVANRLLIAGGGGGAGLDCSGSCTGGNGGGTAAQNGDGCGSYTNSQAGQGGSTSPGLGGTGGGANGALGAGGAGLSSVPAGGGGGGYYGGGGAGYWYGGGGGSSFSDPLLVTGAIHAQGFGNLNSNGWVKITVFCVPPTLGPITGAAAGCIGTSTTYSTTSTPGGIWSSSNPAVASVGSISGVVTSLSSGTASIGYVLALSCGTVTPTPQTITVNPLPNPITGASNICSATPVTLSSTTLGGTWASSNPLVATVGLSSGIVTGVSQGFATFTYTKLGCTATYATTVNVSPNVYTIGGGGPFCAGSTPPNVTLSSSDVLVNYQLVLNGTTVVSTMPGTGYALNFGPQPTAGPYTINAINTNGGCSLPMSGTVSVSVNPTPTIKNVTPGGPAAFCAGGTGTTIGLNGSTSGISYQLMQGTGAYGAPFTGTGSAFNFPFPVSAAGVYTVKAWDLGTGCNSIMSGVETVSVSPTPNIYAVSGGGGYCIGGSGVAVNVVGSDAGVTYSIVGGSFGSVTGTGSMITFNGVTASGISSVYSVMALSTSTGCSSIMSGTATVNVNPLPEPYAVYAEGGGGYCAGGTGKHIFLTYSVDGISYQLYNTSGMIGLPITGVDGSLDFGAQTAAGPYTVIGKNNVSHCTNSMTGSAVISINNLPRQDTMGNGGAFCSGGSGVDVKLRNSVSGTIYQLYNNGVFTGSADTSTGGLIDFGLQTGGGVYRNSFSVLATNPVTGCVNNMIDTSVVLDNPLPNSYFVSGGGGYCVGGAGKHVYLSGSDNLVNYQLYLGSGMLGAPVAGNGSSLDFGADTGAGSYTVIATNTSTGCMGSMSGSTSISINALPEPFDVTGGGNFCAGSAGVPVGLSFSNSGVSYQLKLNGSPVEFPLPGLSGPISFGPQTAPGIYTISAINTITGCSVDMTGSKVVAATPSPTVYNVTGGGGYCSGGPGRPVGLSASNSGVTYQLFNGSTFSGTPVSGTGYPISFGNQTEGGTYMVVASNSTTGCNSNMAGMATVTLNSLPLIYTVTGGGGYCVGGSGRLVNLNSSDTSVNYQLYNGSTAMGAPVMGTGTTLGFGLQTSAGSYSVIATNAVTSCISNMTGSADIEIYPLPTGYTMTGGGSFCAGATGVPVGLDGSNIDVSYALSNGTTYTGITLTGTGGPITFATEITPGTYTVAAVNTATGCSAPMYGGAMVVVNPLPNPYTVTGGGTYCADSTAPVVGVSASDAGVHYMLYNGTTLIGTYSIGTGASIGFGPIPTSGVYNVVAVNPATSCSSSMTGTATVNTLPVVNPMVTAASTATTVCSGTSVTFSATPTSGGSTPAYQWYVGTTPAATGATYSYTPANGDVVSVVLTSSAACASGPATSNNITMLVNPSVTASVATASMQDSVCQGTDEFFYAVPVNGGLAPTYTFYKNGAMVQSGPELTYSTLPSTGDAVYVTMTSSALCATPALSTGSTITMYVQQPMTPTVSLAASPGVNVTTGGQVTFTATAANTTNPVYSWEINGNTVPGATSHIFTASNFADGDVVTSNVTNEDLCGAHTGSAFKTIHVLPEGVGQINSSVSNLTVAPNPSNGDFIISGVLSSNDDVALSVEVTNVIGQVIYSTKVIATNGKINEHIQLSNSMANGAYLLNIRSEAGNAVFHIVVEK